MVLANLSIDKLRREARKERDAEWEAWLKRRDEAHQNDQPFDEPPPSQQPHTNGQR